MEELIQQAVIGCSFPGFILLLFKLSASKETVDRHDQHLLKLSGNYSMAGLILSGMSLTVLCVPLFIEDVFYPFYSVFLVLAISGMGLHLFGRNHHLKFDDVTIEGRNYMGKTQLICWTDISSLHFNPVTHFYSLKDVNHRQIVFSSRLKGVGPLIKRLEESVSISRK